jgi:hypothetical protein
MKKEIQKAIAAHKNWKKELSKTISSGELDTPVEVIAQDTDCEFGRWLRNSGNKMANKSEKTYNKIVILHSEFHNAAGKVAAMAVAGKKEAAKRMMAKGGSYATLSDKLIKALEELIQK